MKIQKTALGLGAAVLALGLAACDPADLTSVNQNPNDPTDAPTTTLFTNATRNAVGRWMDGVGGTRYAFLPQHMAEVQYPESDAYLRLRGSNTSGLFDASYNVELQDFQIVIARGLAASEAGTYAPAMTMKSWEMGIITDAWGDIPYSQAFRADSGILLPAYDEQRAIYADLFDVLEKASTDLSGASNELGTADPIFAGAPAKWQKFANSLRARHALRLVNVDQATASAELQAAFAAPGGVILANADNATLQWPGDGVYDNPWAANFRGRDDHRISDNLLVTLEANNDPRIYVLAQRAENDAAEVAGITEKWCPDATVPCYAGVANALTHPQASPNMPTTSRICAIWYPGATTYGTFGGAGASYPSYLMTAAEMQDALLKAAPAATPAPAPAEESPPPAEEPAPPAESPRPAEETAPAPAEAAPADAEELATLAQGLKLFPRDQGLVYYTAALNLRLGNHEAALALEAHVHRVLDRPREDDRTARLRRDPGVPANGFDGDARLCPGRRFHFP
mgnify:CR=1 FL=1